jgi:hypothetical protein
MMSRMIDMDRQSSIRVPPLNCAAIREWTKNIGYLTDRVELPSIGKILMKEKRLGFATLVSIIYFD